MHQQVVEYREEQVQQEAGGGECACVERQQPGVPPPHRVSISCSVWNYENCLWVRGWQNYWWIIELVHRSDKLLENSRFHGNWRTNKFWENFWMKVILLFVTVNFLKKKSSLWLWKCYILFFKRVFLVQIMYSYHLKCSIDNFIFFSKMTSGYRIFVVAHSSIGHGTWPVLCGKFHVTGSSPSSTHYFLSIPT